MRVWEPKHNWSHTVSPSTQIPSLPSSSVSTNIGSKWPQNGDYCLADASFMKVRRARFCHAAQLQGCHFKIMTGVTFAGCSAKVRFNLRCEKIPKNSSACSGGNTQCALVHSCKFINRNERTNEINSSPFVLYSLWVAGDRHRRPQFLC